MKPPTQWEYRVETLGTFWTGTKDDVLEIFLDEIGEEGWEVFSIENPPNSNKLRIVAKRPLAQAARRRRSWPGE
ncbi:MAG: DUF4177 domain-containing protein [Anaerolineales bacterium]|nr:MAG: DUF4177 domain-containing protein [Anaerolineales bacterium]